MFSLRLLFVAAACAAPQARAGLDGIDLGEPEKAIEAPLQDIAVLSNVVGEENGEPVIYYTVAGSPALFHVVALGDYRVKATYPLPGASRAWAHAIAPDGSVYIGAVGSDSGHLYRYQPGTDAVEDLGAPVQNNKFIWTLTSDDEGVIYGGTWDSGHVFRYDPETDTFSDYGRIQEKEDYVRAIAWHDGFVFAGTGTQNGRVWRLNPETGEKQKLEIPVRPEYEDRMEKMGGIYHLQVAADLLFVRFSPGRLLLVYDLEKAEWWDEMFTDTRGMVSGFLSQDEKTFFLYTTGGIRRIDLETRETSNIVNPGAIFRGGDWIDLPDGQGSAFASVTYNGTVLLINPDRKYYRTLPTIATSQPTPIQALETGPEGMLYVSGYMGTTAARIDPAEGKIDRFNLGQAEGIGFLDGRIYWGEYPGAEIKSSPLEKPSEVRTHFKVGYHQDRPFAIASGSDRIFFGTIPGYGDLGGALTVFQPDAPEAERVRVFPDIIPNQSIVSLAYGKGRRIFGSTSVHGGLGIDPTETKGEVFAFDLETEEVVARTKIDLPGVGNTAMVGGVALGPDGNLYGAVNGTIFVLDPETLDVIRHRLLYPDVKAHGRWRPVHLRWGDDGLLYANVAGRITVIDPETLAFRETGASSGLMTLGKDGTIYYVNNPHIMKIAVKPVAE